MVSKVSNRQAALRPVKIYFTIVEPAPPKGVVSVGLACLILTVLGAIALPALGIHSATLHGVLGGVVGGAGLAKVAIEIYKVVSS